MKPVIAILGFLTFFASCNSAPADDVQAFIPGTYVRASQHEYGKEWDTLAIELQNATANQYQVTRRWRYERVLAGQPQEPEYKVTTTAAIYDAQGKKLQEARSGKIYTFDPKSGVLFSGANKFEKLK